MEESVIKGILKQNAELEAEAEYLLKDREELIAKIGELETEIVRLNKKLGEV